MKHEQTTSSDGGSQGLNPPTPANGPTAVPASMGKDVGRGMSWMLLATVISKVATSVAQVLLGWWLLPEHFRNFAMATTIAGLLMLAKDGGIPNFLNKRGSGEYEDLKGPSFWMCNAYNLAAALLMAVAAYPLAIWYEDPKLAPMLWVMAIALPLGTPAAMLQAKLRLDLRFKAFGMLMALTIILRQVLTIIFAKMGWEEMSLAAPVVITSIFDSIAAWWVCNDKPWKKAAELVRWPAIFRETRWLINGTVASFTIDWGPYVVLGKLLSRDMMGYYFFAYQITAQVGMLLAFNLQMVLMPVLAKLNEQRERQGVAFVRVLRGLTLVGSFLCMGIASVMSPLEHLLWRGKWHDAVGAVVIFGVFYPWRVGFAVTCAAMMAQGRFKFYSMTAWFEGIVLTLAAAVGAWMEPTATSVAWWTGVTVVVTRLLVTAEVFRYSGISLKLLPGAVFPGWLVAVAAGAVGWWVERATQAPMGAWLTGLLPLDGALLKLLPERLREVAQVSVIDTVRCAVAGCTFVATFTLLTRLVLAGDLREAMSMAPARLRGPMSRLLMLR